MVHLPNLHTFAGRRSGRFVSHLASTWNAAVAVLPATMLLLLHLLSQVPTASALPAHRVEPALLGLKDKQESADRVRRAEASWPDNVLAAVQDRPFGAYYSLIDPLAAAVSITYSSASGPFFEPKQQNATIPGWSRRPELEVDPSSGGVHARVFVEDGSDRAIVAFRGICQDDAYRQCQVDKCLLQKIRAFGNITALAYYTTASCDTFNREFNYAEQALTIVNAVQGELPNRNLLLTGHSLGGALAIVAAASQPARLKAVTFAPTPFHTFLEQDLKLSRASIAALPASNLVAVGDPYDCLINSLYVPEAREGATTCLLQGTVEPKSCQDSLLTVGASSGQQVVQSLKCKGAVHDWNRYAGVLAARSPGGGPAYVPDCSEDAAARVKAAS